MCKVQEENARARFAYFLKHVVLNSFKRIWLFFDSCNFVKFNFKREIYIEKNEKTIHLSFCIWLKI